MIVRTKFNTLNKYSNENEEDKVDIVDKIKDKSLWKHVVVKRSES